VFLAAIALAFSLIFGGSTPAPVNFSQLPATQPGLSRNEGVFFVTDADDGSRAVYFIAGNTRHSIVWTDMQIELQLNPLWPVFTATRDQVLDFPEGAPIGAAKTGLVGGTPAPTPSAPATPPTPPVQPAPPAPPASPAPAPTQPAVTDDSQPTSYTLKLGDNLTRIAAQYGTSVAAILAANGLPNPNRIYAGQTLVIPTADPVVADDASTSDESAAEEGTTYTVQRGDSAIKIARNFGIDESALLEANGIANPNRVYVGQVLTIPDSSS
jgi:LysM repeat protein